MQRTNALVSKVSNAPARSVRPSARGQRPSRLVVRAESEDFDAVLMKYADKFEKMENKPAVVAWGAAGVSAFIFTEWLIHLPALDVLLGFPIQMIGVLMLPTLLYRYIKEEKSVTNDVESEVAKLTRDLPGFK